MNCTILYLGGICVGLMMGYNLHALIALLIAEKKAKTNAKPTEEK